MGYLNYYDAYSLSTQVSNFRIEYWDRNNEGNNGFDIIFEYNNYKYLFWIVMTPTDTGTSYKQHIGLSRRTIEGVLLDTYWYLWFFIL